MEAIQRNGSPNRKNATMAKTTGFPVLSGGARFRLLRRSFRRASGPSSGGGTRFRSGTLVGESCLTSSPLNRREKTRKINRILGSGYVVRASLGHVRDLPQPKRDGRSPGKQRQQVGRGLDIVGGSDPTT